MKTIFFLTAPLVLAFPLFASTQLQKLARTSLQVALDEQIMAPDSYYWKGEFPTRIQSTLVPIMVGVGKAFGSDQEASAFTTASVVNQLASIYLKNPDLQSTSEFQEIPRTIHRAVNTFDRYQEGRLYNFYPSRHWKGKKVHQPIAMSLWPLWKGFTNIPQDADTTSTVYTALAYNQILRGDDPQLPSAVLSSFEKFRDLNREPHYYNQGEKQVNTGAYLTWQMDENDPQMPRFYFAQPDKGTRIPFNRNDVDCIVNLNVLRMLAVYKTSAPGQTSACQILRDIVHHQKASSCGIYYPNTFNLSYSLAHLSEDQGRCLPSNEIQDHVEFILKGQMSDGSWDNDRNIWKDPVQTTAFAMAGLLQFGDITDRRVRSSLAYGAAFLLRSARLDHHGRHYWPGEVFFTATALARSLVVWKSTAYTTATVTDVLLGVSKAIPDMDVEDYLKLN